ncbi:MAG: nucleotidyl transferase AbiEii/AbiGii toxin family protein [Candidatus Aenigmarchaeota archaeon]|nr:nucleotidyl transferase AbiEii/AbiGii toxin family protein [Candidatus Aenigmarchaeota archaeon]
MISKEDLKKLTKLTGFDLWQTEKDYLQHVFLMFLSRETKNQLVFKGGTALQKVYGLNRFSVDLDFTSLSDGAEETIKKISEDMTIFGLETNISTVKSSPVGKTFVLRIKGPLYDGTERSISTLRLEISLRKDLILEPEIKEVIPVYPDIRPYLLLVMRLEEILAEKVRAICWRSRSRDVYDLWFLLRRGVKCDLKLVNEKLKYYNLKFQKESFIQKIEETKKNWKSELERIVSFVPDFEKVKNEILALMFES